jgi:hypothetical protein
MLTPQGLATQSHQSHGHHGLDQAIEQNGSHTVIITVPQPPVIIVTSIDALEDLSGEHQDVVRSKSPEVLVMSTDSKASAEQEVLYERAKSEGGPSKKSKRRRDHDGATDADDDDPLSHAAAALRKVLDAATVERRSKTPDGGLEFIWNDPIDVNTEAAAAKKSANKARSKAVAGRG